MLVLALTLVLRLRGGVSHSMAHHEIGVKAKGRVDGNLFGECHAWGE